MNRRLERRRFAVSGQKTFVETIEPSGDALGMELGVTSELGFAVQTVRGAYSLLYIRGCNKGLQNAESTSSEKNQMYNRKKLVVCKERN
jgi:hypothetical protein